MWWRERSEIIRAMARLGVVLAVAGLVAGCFEPLYGRNPSLGNESIRDKLAEVLIAPIPTRQGTPEARIARRKAKWTPTEIQWRGSEGGGQTPRPGP